MTEVIIIHLFNNIAKRNNNIAKRNNILLNLINYFIYILVKQNT